MNDCLFCKIIAKEIPASIIYEDAAALAILDIHPKSLGHAVVLPKRHAPTILEMPEEELGPLFTACFV
ncbi:HIT domain-containing protein, partial [Patescibacteria group bacterium]|nr:HIT domain-containing protein [Patescibacteria group bacterium]